MQFLLRLSNYQTYIKHNIWCQKNIMRQNKLKMFSIRSQEAWSSQWPPTRAVCVGRPEFWSGGRGSPRTTSTRETKSAWCPPPCRTTVRSTKTEPQRKTFSALPSTIYKSSILVHMYLEKGRGFSHFLLTIWKREN